MKAVSGAVGGVVLVQTILVLAKVTGHVDWGWALVLVPLEALAALALVTLALLVFMATEPIDCGFDDVDEEEDRDA